VEIKGVVDASGGGGGMSQGDEFWTFTFCLAAWRIDNGAINRTELIVRRLATKQQLDSLRKLVPANAVVKLKGRVALENVYQRPEALLEKFIGVEDADAELTACLNDLLKPVVHTDEFFGELTLDRTVGNFLGKTKWNDVEVDLWLRLEDLSELGDAIRNAHQLWADSLSWNQRVLDCVVRELLPLKSENWQEDDGTIVSREEFEQRIKLKFIAVGADGAIEFWFDDDDLFFGHDIAAEGTLKDGMRSAGIHG
jgi:hypothetical protein